MKNETILKKAIEKAGIKVPPHSAEKAREMIKWDEHYSIIFSHDFAKAFWGEGEACGTEHEAKDFVGGYCDKQMWQYHLAQMVLEEKPLLYLKKFL